MIFIEVMYGDYTRKRVVLDAADTLPKENVLWIILATDETPRNRKNLVARAYGKDYYELWFDKRSIILDGWDDNDLYSLVRSRIHPHAAPKHKRRRFTRRKGTIVFVGGYVSPNRWEQARQMMEAAY